MKATLQVSYFTMDGRRKVYPFWNNFINHLRLDPNDTNGYADKFQSELDKYKAECSSTDDWALYFETEADMSLFLLRWS